MVIIVEENIQDVLVDMLKDRLLGVVFIFMSVEKKEKYKMY